MDAVVDTITTPDAFEEASKDAIFEAFGASFHSLSEIAKLAVDKERGTPGPAAGITEEICKLEGFAGVPEIDALGDSAGLIGTADALTDLLDSRRL